MVDTRAPRSDEDAVLKRVLEMRRKDCDLLDTSIISKIVREKWQQLNLQSKETDAREQFVVLLKHCLLRAADEALSVSKRRFALEAVKTMLKELDSNLAATKKNTRREEDNGTSRTSSSVSPVHSLLEHIAQPTDTRPNAVYEPKAKRSLARATTEQTTASSPSNRQQTNPGTTSAASRVANIGWPDPPSRPSQELLKNKASSSVQQLPEKRVPASNKASTSVQQVSKKRVPAQTSNSNTSQRKENSAPPSTASDRAQTARPVSQTITSQTSSSATSVHKQIPEKNAPGGKSTSISNNSKRNDNTPLPPAHSHQWPVQIGWPAPNKPPLRPPTLDNVQIGWPAPNKPPPPTLNESSVPQATASSVPPPPSRGIAEKSSVITKPLAATSVLPALEQLVESQQTTSLPKFEFIQFPPDLGVPFGTKVKTRSGLLDTRIHSLKVRCRPTHLTSALAQDIDKRIREWEPFRKPLAYVTMGLTSKVFAFEPESAGNFARTAARIQLDLTKPKIHLVGNFATGLANYPGINWGSKGENGVELVLMMLPLNRSSKDQAKRADGHLWPKGSFLVVDNNPQELNQRRQESHDRTLWKGNSHPLDLGPLIKDPRKTVNIDLCCYDEDIYIYCVMLCSVQTPETLYRQLTEPGPTCLERINREESMKLAVEIASRQVVQLDCDDDMDTELGKLVFSLVCPVSKRLMETPVRSRKCSHWQCFDLKFFLQTNQYIGGARWRCGACDPRFVSPSELQICGLTADLVNEFKDDVSPVRNRIELVEDGTYRLLSEKRPRRNGLKRVMSSDGNGAPAKKTQEEIIIDDD